MRHLIHICFGIILFTCHAQDKPKVIDVSVIESVVTPKHYIISKTSEDIIVDGKASELSWENASFTDYFIDIEGIKEPKYKTKTKMLWDDQFIYVYAELSEPHVWGTLKQRDTIIYYNNDFEVFIDPSQTGIGYGEIEINALNTVWDLYLNKPYRIGGHANFEWNLNKLKSAVQIHGSLNTPNDIDSLWTVELAIPIKPLIALKNRPKSAPKEGEQWRINFSRVQWDHDIIDGQYYRKKEDGKFLPEYNWVWSNQKVINMHEPEKWGVLQFTENSNTQNIPFIQDADLLIKQTAFSLFRKTRYKDLKYLLNEPQGNSKVLNVLISKDNSITVMFYKTLFGFEYKINSPITDITYIINQEGSLKAL